MKTIDIVVAGYIIKEGKILLVDHKKLNRWLPPGGHIDENETPDDTLKREIKEELPGLEIELLNYPEPTKFNNKKYALPVYVETHPIKKDHFHYCLFYLCKTKSCNFTYNKDELNGYKWFSSNELNEPRVSSKIRKQSLEAIELSRIL